MTTLKAYSDIRGLLKTGDILLCAGQGVVDKGIASVTDSPWTHAALIRIDEGRVMVFEAVGTGVRYYPLSRLLDRRKLNGEPHYSMFRAITPYIGETNIPERRIVRACLDAVGAPYAYDQIGKLWWQSHFGGSTPENDDLVKFVCSALCSWAWRQSGYDLLNGISDLDTTPALLDTIRAASVIDFTR